MFRDSRPGRGLSGLVDWLDDQWDASPLGGRGPGVPSGGFGQQEMPPFGQQPPRRGRGVAAVVAAILAVVVAERLLFRRSYRHRSTLGNLVYAVLAISLGTAAVSAWRRHRRPFNL